MADAVVMARADDVRCRICGWIVSRTVPHPCLDRVTRLPGPPPSSAAGDHDWRAVTAPNGDRGYQCARCRLTAITLPLRYPIPCPAPRPWRRKPEATTNTENGTL